MTAEGPIFPVGFDELALAEDLSRLGEGGVRALVGFRREIERQGGLPRKRLMECQADGLDGTRLKGCFKTYAPWPTGRFGAVLIPVSHPSRPVGLRAVAFGVRHHPREANALTVYDIAHRRLNAESSS